MYISSSYHDCYTIVSSNVNETVEYLNFSDEDPLYVRDYQLLRVTTTSNESATILYHLNMGANKKLPTSSTKFRSNKHLQNKNIL